MNGLNGKVGNHVSLKPPLQVVVEYFNRKVEEARATAGRGDWSVETVLQVVRAELRSFRPDRLKQVAARSLTFINLY